MKKFTILISVLLSLNILSLVCFAQGSVNSNNALGEPADGQTNDPYTGTDTQDTVYPKDTVLTDTAAATDTAAVTTVPGTVSDTVTTSDGADSNMTTVIVLIILAVIVAAVLIILLVMRKSKPE